MTSKRRKEYLPIEKFPIYHKEFDRLRMASRTLNYTVFNDELSIRNAILILCGNKEGFYYREHEALMAKLPAVKERLKEIEFEFKRFQSSRINQGFEKPKMMPTDLQDEKYKAEAREDVLKEELEFLQKQLKVFTEQAQQERTEKMLKYGLRCSGSFHGIGTTLYNPQRARAVIDDQYVTQLPDGLLIIDDDRSPYDGLSVPDYRKLAKEWMKKVTEDDEKLLKKMQEEARRDQKPIPWATGRLRHVVETGSLPAWPNWAKNYKRVEIQKEDNKKRIKK